MRSHPTMGAWIEIVLPKMLDGIQAFGRTPRWVRGLKLQMVLKEILSKYVAPHDGCVDWNF